MSASPGADAADKNLVLVIEDDQSTYVALRRLLEHYGFAVRHASTTAQGMAMLSDRPQWVLLDLMLPDGDGARVLEQIRGQGLATRVAVVTAVNDPQRLERVQKLKPDLVLSKPLDLIKLLEQIKPCEK